MTLPYHNLSTYQYALPKELIAKQPCKERGGSRVLIVDREKQSFEEISFGDLIDLIEPRDQLVFNDARVLPAKLFGRKESGAHIEIFLLEEKEGEWIAMAKPGKKLKPQDLVHFAPDFSCEILETLADGTKRIRFSRKEDFWRYLEKYGKLPLPPYMERKACALDAERYQTVFAKKQCALAAPTAGLHFTQQHLTDLKQRGVDLCSVTLHVGLGTFKPVQTEDIRLHLMHEERFSVEETTAEKMNAVCKRRILVGTTTLRVAETLSQQFGRIVPGSYATRLFIYPGYTFGYPCSLLTNFHLPGSTLLMLVCAFGGYSLVMEAYKKAVQDRFRFFSYGDAMLIV